MTSPTPSPQYANDNDYKFVAAAELAITALEDCISWIDMLQRRRLKDSNYDRLLTWINDFAYDRDLATAYIQRSKEAIEALTNPNTSSPESRHSARELIAQLRTWTLEWNKGDRLRNAVYGATIAPQDAAENAYAYTSPSMISGIMVPGDIIPGYDPFADSPISPPLPLSPPLPPKDPSK